MPTREEMRNLAEEIVGSYADRVAGIAQIRQTVKMDLKGFQDSRRAMARELRADLAKGVADRKREVGGMLNGFEQALAAMSKEMKADLAKGVADRKREVGGMLDGFGQALATMSKETRADLAKGVADRKREVGGMLNSFGQALAIMGKEMRADLAEGVADRKRHVGTLLGGFSAELKDIRSELAGGREEWQKLTSTMQSRRGGVAFAVKPLIEEIPERAAEITPETAALSNRVFEYLANHPDGTKMTELEEEFGLARIQMARIVRSLMDENKVNKQDLLYFAI